MDCSPPGSSVHGIPQGRTLGWVVIFFSRGSSPPKDQNHVSCVAGAFFTTSHLASPQLSPDLLSFPPAYCTVRHHRAGPRQSPLSLYPAFLGAVSLVRGQCSLTCHSASPLPWPASSTSSQNWTPHLYPRPALPPVLFLLMALSFSQLSKQLKQFKKSSLNSHFGSLPTSTHFLLRSESDYLLHYVNYFKNWPCLKSRQGVQCLKQTQYLKNKLNSIQSTF